MSKDEFKGCFSDEALKAINAAFEPSVIKKEVGGNKGKSVTWVANQPFEHNTFEWGDDYMLYAPRQETKMHMNAGVPFDTAAVESPVYNSSSRTFREAKLRLDEQILNSANYDVDCCYNISVDSSQRSGGTQD